MPLNIQSSQKPVLTSSGSSSVFDKLSSLVKSAPKTSVPTPPSSLKGYTDRLKIQTLALQHALSNYKSTRQAAALQKLRDVDPLLRDTFNRARGFWGASHVEKNHKPSVFSDYEWGNFVKAYQGARQVLTASGLAIGSALAAEKAAKEVAKQQGLSIRKVVISPAPAAVFSNLVSMLESLLTQSMAVDPAVSIAAKGKLAEFFQQSAVLAKLQSSLLPAGIDATTWARWVSAVNQAATIPELAALGIGFQDLLAQEPIPDLTVEDTIVTEEYVSTWSRLKNSVREHPILWGLGAVTTGYIGVKAVGKVI